MTTLLQKITAAVAAAGDGTLTPSTKHPTIILTPDFSSISSIESPSVFLATKCVSPWTSLSSTDSRLIEISSNFMEKIQSFSSISRSQLFSAVDSFVSELAELARVTTDRSDRAQNLKRVAFLVTKNVAFVLAACIVTETWDLLEVLVAHKLFDQISMISFIEKLAEKNRADMLCLCAKHLSDLRADELLVILKFFLSPNSDSYNRMVGIRKEWEKETLLAAEIVTQKRVSNRVLSLARKVAILMMMGHDGFSSAEICLHFVFGAGKADALVLSSAISQLNGSEVVGLVRYFMKWLEKYQKFPEAVPCSSAAAETFGLRFCDSVPLIEDVVLGLGIVLDEHYSYLALNSEFRDLLGMIEKTVNSLASEAESCHRVKGILTLLMSNRRDN